MYPAGHQGLPMVYTFIWDFDGVIVFTPHEEAWRIATKTYGDVDLTHEFYVNYVAGKPRLEGGRIILEKLGIYRYRKAFDKKSREKLLLEFTNYKNKVYRELIEKGVYKVNWDAVNFVLKAKKHGIIQVLASASKNAAPLAYRIVLDQGIVLAKIFDIDASGKGATKEDVFREAVNAVIERYGFIKCCIVFDDSPSGIAAAKKVKLKAVGYRDERLLEKGADLVVYKFTPIDPLYLIKLLRC